MDLVFVWVVDIDLISAWGVDLDFRRIVSLGIGNDLGCVWMSKMTWFIYLDRTGLGFCVMFDRQ